MNIIQYILYIYLIKIDIFIIFMFIYYLLFLLYELLGVAVSHVGWNEKNIYNIGVYAIIIS